MDVAVRWTAPRSRTVPKAPDSPTARLVRRVRGEYLEMPGLSLTENQACRLFGFDRTACRAIMDTLVHVGFLRRRARDETFVRAGAR